MGERDDGLPSLKNIKSGLFPDLWLNRCVGIGLVDSYVILYNCDYIIQTITTETETPTSDLWQTFVADGAN